MQKSSAPGQCTHATRLRAELWWKNSWICAKIEFTFVALLTTLFCVSFGKDFCETFQTTAFPTQPRHYWEILVKVGLPDSRNRGLSPNMDKAGRKCKQHHSPKKYRNKLSFLCNSSSKSKRRDEKRGIRFAQRVDRENCVHFFLSFSLFFAVVVVVVCCLDETSRNEVINGRKKKKKNKLCVYTVQNK